MVIRQCSILPASRPRFHTRGRALLAVLLAGACGESSPATGRVQDAALFERMLAAEDERGRTRSRLTPLLEGAQSADPALRRIAVRAFGRLEQTALVPDILLLLDDTDATVRAEAANALGQAVRSGSADLVRPALHERASTESDAYVRGVIAETLGRLPNANAAAVRETVVTITTIATTGGIEAIDAHLGSARGYFFLTRQTAARDSMPDPAISALRSLLTYGRSTAPGSDSLATAMKRIRTVAAAALFASGAATRQDFETVVADADPWVRREAAAALGVLRDPARDALITRALADSSPTVRYDALRAHTRLAAGAAGCPAVRAGLTDPAPHVRLLAIDLAPAHCTGPETVAWLDSVAGTLPDTIIGWHDAAHAIVGLSALDADRASARIDAFVSHPSFFVRAWAAQAATRLQDETLLGLLANDVHPNVRTAAITGLASLRGHGADSIYIAQLEQDDSQLIQTAAGALEQSTHTGALDALLAALERFTERGRLTERDARMALLERIAELGDSSDVNAIRPYRRDIDPAVATRTAEILGTWTGTPTTADLVTPTRLPLPAIAELEQLASSRVLLVMASGDTIEITLRPFDAPTNAARFARLARDGHFDGLTFHRIAPNFVIQGGSPNANEYSGDGPFTRDELVIRANWRGTVGLSTRGRDTGDAQIYVNLIDNVRLDHDYTVFGEVVRGMDVVDRLLEGDVIADIIVR